MTKRKNQRTIEPIASISVPLELIDNNEGQIPGVRPNPRQCSATQLRKLKKSLERDAGLTAVSEIKAYPFNGRWVAIGGNMRLKAMRQLGWSHAVVKPIPVDTDAETLNRLIVIDNASFGDWELEELLRNWDLSFLEDIGIDIDKTLEEINIEGSDSAYDSKDTAKTEEAVTVDGEEEENREDKEAFYRSMFKDVLYESDNIFEIPNLLLEMQAGKVELPFSPWGANSRLRKDVATYHFYVDDYRFEALFKDPINLLTSGCKAIVEPNCSCHDQTPIAYGLQLIYKKRWLARYLQECGIKVYADLNVSRKFIDYNKMGIPRGYNAFFTRGLDGWMESLRFDLEVAREISGLKCPNLVVYGGGEEVKRFCCEHGLLYITDFINAKKK